MIPPELAPRVLALTGDFNGCVWWRVTSPMSELFRRGYPCFVGRNQDEDTTAHIPGMDAVILPRLSWKPEDQQLGRNWRESLHAMGIAMIFEWDDDVFSERIVRRAAEVYPEEGKSAEDWEIERLCRIRAIELADGLTCSTPRLATVLRQFVDVPVKVVPNLIDLDWWRMVQRTVRRGLPEPVIGWAGGRRPDRDAEPMAEAWAKVARRHPEARFVVAGWQPGIFGRIPSDQLVLSEWLPVLEYPKNYVGVDIGCCPLSEEPFNRCKCVTGDTLVMTEDGPVPIESLSQSRLLDGIIPLNKRVWARDGCYMATHFYYGGEQDTIRITTKRGFVVEGTPDHRIMRADEQWARLDSLTIGDAVMIQPMRIPFESYASVSFNPWAVRNRQEAKTNAPSLPTVAIDENWGAVLGYIIGDGHIAKNHVRISCDAKDLDVIEHLMDRFEALGFNPSASAPRTRVKAGTGCIDVGVSSARFNDFLWLIGMHQEKRKAFAVPDVIWRSPKPVVAVFLAALFETDGTVDVKNSRLYFTTRSERLATEVRLLLTAFGVLANVTPVFNKLYQRYYYRVELNRAACDVFAQEVGFIGARKRASVEAIVAKEHSNRYRPQQWSDEIAKIERGRREVFDITVPGPHEFVGNSFVNHNSNIKALEWAVSGAAVVASPTVYGGLIDHGRTGYLASTTDEWEWAIEDLLASRERRLRMAKRLLRVVERDWALERHAHRWVEAWADIVTATRRRLAEAQPALILPPSASGLADWRISA